MLWNSWGGWYITSIFLRLIFSLNAFADFEKPVTISWSWSTKQCCQQIWARLSEHFWLFLQIYIDWRWTGLSLCNFTISLYIKIQTNWQLMLFGYERFYSILSTFLAVRFKLDERGRCQRVWERISLPDTPLILTPVSPARWRKINCSLWISKLNCLLIQLLIASYFL